MRRVEPGVWLYTECLNQLELDPEDRGLCHHNLAIQYRDMKKPRKFKINLQKAMKIWNEIDAKYDIAITWGFLAHAHYLLSETEKHTKAKKKAITLLDKLEDTDHRLSWGFIHMADNARKTHDVRWEIESLSNGFDYASKLHDESHFNYINERLIAIHQGKDPYELEKRGLLFRPPMMSWINIGSSFHPVLPSKDTPTA